LCIQPCSPFIVFHSILKVLTTIGLNHQLFLIADKINDELAYLFLTSKLQPVKLFGFEMTP